MMRDDLPEQTTAEEGDLHVPGAGAFGLGLLVVSLSMLFVASMVALLMVRAQAGVWPPHGMPPLPSTLWISTLVILGASVAVHRAVGAIRRNDRHGLVRNLAATFVIGVIFLVMQSLNWVEFFLAIRQIQFSGAYMGMFYFLTGLHAAHVVGGLVPLWVVLKRARAGRYSADYYPGVKYVGVYWHFLDVIWVALFGVIYF
jgi:heme/copper-type cytochrome/quinol oxidase subunit 3